METYRLEDTTLAGLPVLTIAPEGGTGRRPAVLYVHGFTLDRRAGVELGYQLAERGLFVISLDAAMHGARSRPPLNDGPQPPEPGRSPEGSGLSRYLWMMRIVERTAQDVGRLLEALEGDPRVDADRLGMAGASMGGFTGCVCAARYPQIRALAAQISFPTLALRWEDLLVEARADPRFAGQVNEDAAAADSDFIRALDPVQALKERYAPRPLLLQCGEVDLDAPRFYSLQFYKEMQPLYRQHPDRLRLTLYEGVAHRISSAMRREAVEWFERHLA